MATLLIMSVLVAGGVGATFGTWAMADHIRREHERKLDREKRLLPAGGRPLLPETRNEGPYRTWAEVLPSDREEAVEDVEVEEVKSFDRLVGQALRETYTLPGEDIGDLVIREVVCEGVKSRRCERFFASQGTHMVLVGLWGEIEPENATAKIRIRDEVFRTTPYEFSMSALATRRVLAFDAGYRFTDAIQVDITFDSIPAEARIWLGIRLARPRR